MKWLDRLEARHPSWGLEGLIRYISLLMLTVFFLNHSGMLPYYMLDLRRDAILAGQVWRLFTFLLIPVSSSIFFLIFELSIMVMCADGLEARWGTFKLTAYYSFGALFTIMGLLFVPEMLSGSYFIYLSMFLGFATLYPDYEILFMFVISVKIKYLAMLSGAFMVFQLAFAPWHIKLASGLAISNYLLFFLKDAMNAARRGKIQTRRGAEYEEAFTIKGDFRHKCSVCNKTDASHPDLQFRYCTCQECGADGKPFCSEHLKQHKESSQS